MVLEETAEKTDNGLGTCVGTIAPSMRVEIIAISDDVIEQWTDAQPLAQGEIGEICARSRSHDGIQRRTQPYEIGKDVRWGKDLASNG